MKKNRFKSTTLKSRAMATAMFVVITLCTKTASSQNIVSAPDPNFGTENASQIEGSYIKWKLVGSWLDWYGIYVFDTWDPDGLFGGWISNSYLAREGTTAGTSVIQNIQTSGYGHLTLGTHTVSVSCDEITTYTSPFPYTYTSSYIKAHTYVVYSPL
jgi:hypothetical protein